MGKTLAIIGGILALVGTFVFTWTNAITSGWGIINIVDSFNAVMGIVDPMDKTIAILILVLFVMTVLSGFMILIGSKVRFLAVLFGLAALLTGGVFIIWFLAYPDFLFDWVFTEALFAMSDPIIVDILPFMASITIDTITIVVGDVLLAVGGLLGIIGGLTKNSED